MRYQINLVTVDTVPHQHKFYEIMVYQRGEGWLHTADGSIPAYGISYVDTDGAEKAYSVNMSGEDGSLYLSAIN